MKHTARDDLGMKISEAYKIKKHQPGLNKKQVQLGAGFWYQL